MEESKSNIGGERLTKPDESEVPNTRVQPRDVKIDICTTVEDKTMSMVERPVCQSMPVQSAVLYSHSNTQSWPWPNTWENEYRIPALRREDSNGELRSFTGIAKTAVFMAISSYSFWSCFIFWIVMPAAINCMTGLAMSFIYCALEYSRCRKLSFFCALCCICVIPFIPFWISFLAKE